MLVEYLVLTNIIIAVICIILFFYLSKKDKIITSLQIKIDNLKKIIEDNDFLQKTLMLDFFEQFNNNNEIIIGVNKNTNYIQYLNPPAKKYFNISDIDTVPIDLSKLLDIDFFLNQNQKLNNLTQKKEVNNLSDIDKKFNLEILNLFEIKIADNEFIIYFLRDSSEKIEEIFRLNIINKNLFSALNALESAFDSINYAIIIFDSAGIIKRMNPTAINFFDTNFRNHFSQCIFKAFNEKINNLLNYYFDILKEKKEQIMYFEVFDNDNNKFYHFTLTAVEYSYNLKEPEIKKLYEYILLVKNITVEIEQMNNNIQTDKMLTLGRMAAALAHEINQPLSGISMSADNILFEVDCQQPQIDFIKEKCNGILLYVNRIKNQIDHIRQFARYQNIKENNNIFNINNIILLTLELLNAQYKKLDISITLDLYSDLYYVKGNQYKFEQVILNLLNNAKDACLEFSMKTGANVGKTIIIKTYNFENNVICKIIDNGCGISETNINKIFEPFFSTKSSDKGTGLGLFIVFGIIKEMRGKIEVNSKINQGTEIILSLPAIKSL